MQPVAERPPRLGASHLHQKAAARAELARAKEAAAERELCEAVANAKVKAGVAAQAQREAKAAAAASRASTLAAVHNLSQPHNTGSLIFLQDAAAAARAEEIHAKARSSPGSTTQQSLRKRLSEVFAPPVVEPQP